MVADPKKLFFPNKAIRQDNKAFFAGRRDLLRKAYLDIGRDDFSGVVYGDRGVGKTSFAWQLMELLKGDRSILPKGLPPSDDSCKCIWLQCQSYMQNIDGVLLSLLRPSIRDHSFATEFPEIYENEEQRGKNEKKIAFNLGLVSAEMVLKDGDDPPERSKAFDISKMKKADVHDFFRNVVDVCKETYPDKTIVIFLDEFDSLPDRSGVGQLIEATDSARFIIIGIADTVDEIVEDHLSAERKLVDSKYRVPRFTLDEINTIFDMAEQAAQQEVIFESDFRDHVVFRSYGYPFLVQQFGHFATHAALDANPSQNPLRVSIEHLHQSIDRLFKHKKESKLYKPLVETLQGDKQAKKEILRITSTSPDYVSIDDIRKQVVGRLKQHVSTNVNALVEVKILKLSHDDRVRFRDPEARILTQLHFDSHESA